MESASVRFGVRQQARPESIPSVLLHPPSLALSDVFVFSGVDSHHPLVLACAVGDIDKR